MKIIFDHFRYACSMCGQFLSTDISVRSAQRSEKNIHFMCMQTFFSNFWAEVCSFVHAKYELIKIISWMGEWEEGREISERECIFTNNSFDSLILFLSRKLYALFGFCGFFIFFFACIQSLSMDSKVERKTTFNISNHKSLVHTHIYSFFSLQFQTHIKGQCHLNLLSQHISYQHHPIKHL